MAKNSDKTNIGGSFVEKLNLQVGAPEKVVR